MKDETYAIASKLAAAITALPSSAGSAEVLGVIKMLRAQAEGDVLGDAFYLLDNRPGKFASHEVWHPRLRALRNDTELGMQMFECFEAGEEFARRPTRTGLKSR